MAQFTQTIAGDVRDPYPALNERRKRTAAELAAGPGIGVKDEPKNVLHVYDYEHVAGVLHDPETFTSEIIRRHMTPVMGPSVLVGLDGEEHRVRRSLVSKAFRQRSIARWDEELVKPIVHGLIDKFAPRGSAELVREFTYLFPVHVIARILGIPARDHDFFRERGLWVVSLSADPSRGINASRELRSYFEDVIAIRRKEPGDDLISHLIEAEIDGERLSDDEIQSFLLFLLPAGVETTYRATGNLLFGLLTHADQLDAVRQDRSLMSAAVEEALRWEPPMLQIPRVTAAATIVAGVAVPAETEVSYCIGSANRDDGRWDEPDRFDLHRVPRQHLAFGSGVHLCLGMHLARMEMASATMALIDRLPGLKMDPQAKERDPHVHGERFRSPTSLPVTFQPTPLRRARRKT